MLVKNYFDDLYSYFNILIQLNSTFDGLDFVEFNVSNTNQIWGFAYSVYTVTTCATQVDSKISSITTSSQTPDPKTYRLQRRNV